MPVRTGPVVAVVLAAAEVGPQVLVVRAVLALRGILVMETAAAAAVLVRAMEEAERQAETGVITVAALVVVVILGHLQAMAASVRTA